MPKEIPSLAKKNLVNEITQRFESISSNKLLDQNATTHTANNTTNTATIKTTTTKRSIILFFFLDFSFIVFSFH